MVVSNRNLLFQWSIFRGYVSFREGKIFFKEHLEEFKDVLRKNTGYQMELYFFSAHDFKECSTSSVVGVKGSFTQDEVAKKGGIESVSSTKDLLHVTCCFYQGKKEELGEMTAKHSRHYKTKSFKWCSIHFQVICTMSESIPKGQKKYNTHHPPHNTFRLSPPLIPLIPNVPTCQGPLCDVGVQPLRLPHRVDGKQWWRNNIAGLHWVVIVCFKFLFIFW